MCSEKELIDQFTSSRSAQQERYYSWNYIGRAESRCGKESPPGISGGAFGYLTI
jgi:hypothetical protein